MNETANNLALDDLAALISVVMVNPEMPNSSKSILMTVRQRLIDMHKNAGEPIIRRVGYAPIAIATGTVMLHHASKTISLMEESLACRKLEERMKDLGLRTTALYILSKG
jgi:hypothetical protein